MKNQIIKREQVIDGVSYVVSLFTLDEKGYRNMEVNIFELPNWGERNSKPKEWGINWGGCGTQTVEDTELFARIILEATAEAKLNNYRSAKSFQLK